MDDPRQLHIVEGPEQYRRFTILLISRLAVVTALVGSTFVFNLYSSVPGISRTEVLLDGAGVAIYLITFCYWIGRKRVRESLDFHVQIQIVLDVLLAAFLVYLTGGVESPFSFFFALPVISTAVFFPRRGTFLTAGLACLLLGALFVMEQQGILTINLEGRVNSPPAGRKVIYLLALNYTVFFVIAWLSGYLGEQLRSTGKRLRNTEDDLEKLAALNRDIVLSLRSGLLAIDNKKNVSWLNPPAEKILGCSAHDCLGRPFVEIFPSLASLINPQPEDLPSQIHRAEVEHTNPVDGKMIPVGLTCSALRGPDGVVEGSLVHMQDLTEQKKLEVSIKRSEKMAALGKMAAGMAHEIRNPLASISGAAQVLNCGTNIGEEQRRLMEIIFRETQRLDTLLSNFLLYARPKQPTKVPTKMAEIVEETVAVFLHSQDGNGGFKVNTHVENVTVLVDPDQIRQVLWNLLTNAAQAVDEQGQVDVSVFAELDSAESPQSILEVTDTGPGIPMELRERIFEPFFTTKAEGSGLGLAIVSQIIEAHQGSIQLQCPEGGGSRFIIRLPGLRHE